MNQQTLNNYYERFKGILKKVKDEVQKLYSKQEELKKREQEIITLKDNTTQILKLLQGGSTSIERKKQEQLIVERKIKDVKKIKDIKHNSLVRSITELSDLRIATGDRAGYLTLFAVDEEREQWTKLKEEKGHN